jgi:hypothetical protein
MDDQDNRANGFTGGAPSRRAAPCTRPSGHSRSGASWRSNGPAELGFDRLAKSRLSLVLSGTVPSQSNRQLRASLNLLLLPSRGCHV